MQLALECLHREAQVEHLHASHRARAVSFSLNYAAAAAALLPGAVRALLSSWRGFPSLRPRVCSSFPAAAPGSRPPNSKPKSESKSESESPRVHSHRCQRQLQKVYPLPC
jgi:hypothetical protein